jgi:hypothetical protein
MLLTASGPRLAAPLMPHRRLSPCHNSWREAWAQGRVASAARECKPARLLESSCRLASPALMWLMRAFQCRNPAHARSGWFVPLSVDAQRPGNPLAVSGCCRRRARSAPSRAGRTGWQVLASRSHAAPRPANLARSAADFACPYPQFALDAPLPDITARAALVPGAAIDLNDGVAGCCSVLPSEPLSSKFCPTAPTTRAGWVAPLSA